MNKFNNEINDNSTEAVTASREGRIYFSEDDHAVFSYDAALLSSGRTELPEGCRRVKLLPEAGSFLILSALTAVTSEGDASPAVTNAAYYEDGVYYFTSTSPEISFDVPEGARWIELSAYITEFQSASGFSPVAKLIKTAQRARLDRRDAKNKSIEIDRIREAYDDTITEYEKLYAEYKNTSAMYENVAHSTFWRITKPARLAVDILKRLIKAITPKRLKIALKRIGKNGVGKELRTVKDRRLYRNDFTSVSTAAYTAEEIEAQRADKFPRDIKFSILVPLYNTPKLFLHEMIRSVLDQTYGNFELCLADGSDAKHSFVGRICKKYSRRDSRIVYRKLEKNLGISENTNACIDMATGNFIALFDHDDLLHPSALHDMMKAICEEGADFVYTDESVFISPDMQNVSFTHYKPDYAPDNLRANNYICHFSAFSREVLDIAGRFRPEFDGSQDHDMILRLTAAAKRVVHIQKVLYFWRSHPASVAQSIGAKTYAIKAGQRAARTAAESLGYTAEVDSTKVSPTVYRIKYSYPRDAMVSIIASDVDDVYDFERTLASLSSSTEHGNYEVIVPYKEGTISIVERSRCESRSSRVRFVPMKDTSRSAMLNAAAKLSKGEYIVFLKGYMNRFSEGWLEELLMYAQRDDVAVASGALYYRDGLIRHAGYALGRGDDGVAGRMYHGYDNDIIGYMVYLWYSHDLSAVSDEMMAVRRSDFLECGGFDESFVDYYYDVDYCIRARERGKLVTFTPYANAYLTVGYNERYLFDGAFISADHETVTEKWGDILALDDPYYNSNFAKDKTDFTIS